MKNNSKIQITKCSVDYVVWVTNKECGVFEINDEEVEGYRMSDGKSSVTLTWNFPESKENFVSVLSKKSWTGDEISYDEMDGLENSVGKGSSDFNNANEELEDVDDFDGDGEEELDSFGSSYGPSVIRFYKNEDVVITFKRENGVINMISEGEELSFSSNEELVEKVREILNIN